MKVWIEMLASIYRFAKKWWVFATLLVGLIVILGALHRHHPLTTWLFWRYVASWLSTLAFIGAACCIGDRVVGWLHSNLPLQEHLALSFAAGVMAIFQILFVVGLLRGYGAACYFSVPIVCIAVGAPSLWRKIQSRWRRLRRLRSCRPSRNTTWSLFGQLLFVAGTLGLLLVYVPILNPQNVSYDARWYHLPIGEQYVIAGGVVPFSEGWLNGTGPHLASFLYAWTFMLPWGGIFDRVEAAAHLEFGIFLVTLFCIPVLLRRIVGGPRRLWSWVTLFLFPGIFVYDSSLNVGADHVAALWAVPIYLSLLHAWRHLEPRACVLLAIFISGALLTKTTAINIVLFPVIAVVAATFSRSVRFAFRRRWREIFNVQKGPLTCLAAGLFLTAPHWLKNLVYHGDPLYPVLHRYFSLRPWTPDSAAWYARFQSQLWTPKGSWAESTVEALATVFTFSFSPNDWWSFHRDWPTFGFLFTVFAVALPALSAGPRLWSLVLANAVGIVTWFYIHHQDRYLQTLLPWIVVATAACMIRCWQGHVANRVLTFLLVGVQVVWTATVVVIPAHAMTKSSGLEAAIKVLQEPYTHKTSIRENPFPATAALRDALPRDAKLLFHEQRLSLGLERAVVLDGLPETLGIGYGAAGSLPAAHQMLRKLGVTHLHHKSKSREWDSIAGDLIFYSLAALHGKNPRAIAGGTLSELGEAPPSQHGTMVAMLGCNKSFSSGVYELQDLNQPTPLNGHAPKLPAPRVPILIEPGESATKNIVNGDFLVYEPKCLPAQVTQEIANSYLDVARRKKLYLAVRRDLLSD